ncbi:hypothetical protein H074_36852 [Amycolatopsis decaplanina DSM 44594]|uniref:Uncharacterized protein n=1 Tax=Amycolatopsis decaplanina DSM 44594 TaxID=1284240 RepID=M2XQD6_9PSEU|nr:hypothetical protein H074_36852 [Amycolatopsis decaplanina DSM 44594]
MQGTSAAFAAGLTAGFGVGFGVGLGFEDVGAGLELLLLGVGVWEDVAGTEDGTVGTVGTVGADVVVVPPAGSPCATAPPPGTPPPALPEHAVSTSAVASAVTPTRNFFTTLTPACP